MLLPDTLASPSLASPRLFAPRTGTDVLYATATFPSSSPQLACGQPFLRRGQTKDKGEEQGTGSFPPSCQGQRTSNTMAGTNRAA